MSFELGGVIPAAVTPMTKDGEVDYVAYERQIGFLAESGVHGFFINGTTVRVIVELLASEGKA